MLITNRYGIFNDVRSSISLPVAGKIAGSLLMAITGISATSVNERDYVSAGVAGEVVEQKNGQKWVPSATKNFSLKVGGLSLAKSISVDFIDLVCRSECASKAGFAIYGDPTLPIQKREISRQIKIWLKRDNPLKPHVRLHCIFTDDSDDQMMGKCNELAQYATARFNKIEASHPISVEVKSLRLKSDQVK